MSVCLYSQQCLLLFLLRFHSIVMHGIQKYISAIHLNKNMNVAFINFTEYINIETNYLFCLTKITTLKYIKMIFL